MYPTTLTLELRVFYGPYVLVWPRAPLPSRGPFVPVKFLCVPLWWLLVPYVFFLLTTT